MNTINGEPQDRDQTQLIDTSFSELEQIQVRQVLYQFFGRLFLYPDRSRLVDLQQIAAELGKDEILWQLFPYGTSLRTVFARLVSISATEQLAIEEEYVRLFVAKPAAVPLESCYVDKNGLARGLIQANLQGTYLDSGLDLAQDMSIPPDHIAVELEFLAFLCAQELRDRQAAAFEQAEAASAKQIAFLNKHLKRWFPAFTQRVHRARADQLYGQVVQAAFEFLRHELQLLDDNG